jgi:phosphoribosylaminoimidazolecarboxamide formyltransferase/IMP cyclohydrolase
MALAARLALLSVSDKTGLVDLGRALTELGLELLSTGGTAASLRAAGLRVLTVDELTGSPEILDGRVKTLHPRVHAGILAKPTPEHMAELEAFGGRPIDLVIVNLYPFRETAARPGVTLLELVEQIDIGGPSMIRGAAKNHARVGVVCDPADYGRVVEELRGSGGKLSDSTRFALACKAFAHTAAYDAAIAATLPARAGGVHHSTTLSGGLMQPRRGASDWPETFVLEARLAQALRYGENPHQKGAFYRTLPVATGGCVAAAEQLGGKELSYNNILDADAAWEAVRAFEATAAVVVKHTNPCGAAVGATLAEAYRRAREADAVSAFGGIVALNRPVDEAAARLLAETFLEAVVAPSFAPAALEVLRGKKDLRLLAVPAAAVTAAPALEVKTVGGGLLVQERDTRADDLAVAKVVTKRAPTADELRGLDLAWRVSAHVKSNAIVLATAEATVGIGAGQMSRVDSVKNAVEKAGERARGAVLASDAFFPFRDGPDAAAKAGVTAIAQPGGSKRDGEVIDAANEHGIAMIFTGTRHFRHG